MITFDTFFGEYLKSCAKLYNAFLPWSLAIMVLAFPFEFARGVEVRRMLMLLAKLFIIVLLSSKSYELINSGQIVVDQFISHTGLVRSEKLAQTYKDRVAATLGEPEIKDKSVFGLMLSGHFLDSICYAALLGISYSSMVVITLITYVQKVTLALCWSVTPILFALIAVEPWTHIGMGHVNRLIAVCCWPIGFCLAATFTDALLNLAIHERLLTTASNVNTIGVALENLVIIAVIGVWDVISTIGAPMFIHRFLVGEAGPGRFVSQAINKVGGVVMVPGAAAAIAVAKQVAAYFHSHRGSGDSGASLTGNGGLPALPIAPLSPPPTVPAGGSPNLDPTGAKELAKLLNHP
jgi:type IV secretion system protein TrbL